MEIFIIYLLKSSGVILLFVLSYSVLLQKETTFKLNRIFLLFGLLLALVLPFVTYTKIIWINSPIVLNVASLNTALPPHELPEPIKWFWLVLLMYVIGCLVLTVRLIIQLLSLRKLVYESTTSNTEGYIMVETKKNIAPFSFFKYIVLYKKPYSEEELCSIITHEKVHVLGLHSLDILFMQLVSIFLWFNPFIWLYKSYMEQNLEFIADHQTAEINQNKKSYQYLLLKTSLGSQQFSIVNPFFNSLIKKRIVMLNKVKSNKKQVWKFATVLPMIIGFIFLFNVKTVAQYNIQTSVELDPEEVVYTIIKERTKAELEELKKQIKSTQMGTLKYNGLKRNEAGYISAITIEYQHKTNGMVRASYSEENGIEPILFGTNTGGGMFIVSGDHEMPYGPSEIRSNIERMIISTKIDRANEDLARTNTYKKEKKHIVILNENDEETIIVNGDRVTMDEFEEMKKEGVEQEIIIKKIKKGNGDDTIWIESFNDTTNKIIIKEVDGKKTIEVNGKTISNEDFEKMKMGKESDQMILHMDHHNNKKKSVFIVKDIHKEMNDENEEELIHSSMMNTADDEKNIKIMINGKESTREEMNKLSPDDIVSVDILKNAKDNEKLGTTNKATFIKITTKKKQ
ncbi:M56 family metallopeptidase [Sediminicola arcticus]|jgi:beta-lactamase regulating signal transducer with metallopeptidase domain|uniref:M56 family metallopeptidase n=1 Tax=Sediminicola arcticus TaxID=1574308 RepID=A0ABV2SSG4_9FLAO